MLSFFFFNDTATTEIYPLSLHDALPISVCSVSSRVTPGGSSPSLPVRRKRRRARSEEHTSELQSHVNLVCRLLLEKKKKKKHRKQALTLTRTDLLRYSKYDYTYVTSHLQ